MRRRVVLGLAVGGVLLLGGCLPRDDAGCPACSGGGPQVGLDLGLERVDQGTSSGIRDARQVVVRDAATWAALWQQHTAGAHPPRPLPEVDFLREMVLAFFLGERPTSGYSAHITDIVLHPDHMLVRVRVGAPPPGTVVLQVLTQPYDIVRVPRSGVPVQFAVGQAWPR